MYFEKKTNEAIKATIGRNPLNGVRTALTAAVFILASSVASATPIEHSFTFQNVHWTSGGVGGIGDAGSGTISISGIDGTVEKAFLYWHGISFPTVGEYDNPDISFDGNPVSGENLGEGSTNCWGDGTSRAYRADVTQYVTGDGSYSFSGLTDGGDFDVNGASLIVIYEGSDPLTSSDLVIFDGNDSSHPEGFEVQDEGWNAVLSPIEYGGGPVMAEFHAADGQNFDSDSIEFSTPNGSTVIQDAPELWSGASTPTEGNSRASNGELWDIHGFDITDAFGGVSGNVELTLGGMYNSSDCKALIVLALDMEPGSAPPPPGEPMPPVEPVEPVEPISVPVNQPWGMVVLSSLLLLLGLLAAQRLRP